MYSVSKSEFNVYAYLSEIIMMLMFIWKYNTDQEY